MHDLTSTPRARATQGEAGISSPHPSEAHQPAARAASNRNTHQPENSMNTNTKTSSTETTERMDAFTVREDEAGGEKRRDWTRIGVAFPHKDGKGFNVILQALPLDGRIELRVHEAKEKDA